MIRPLRAGYVACAVGARTRAAIRAAAPVIASDLSFIRLLSVAPRRWTRRFAGHRLVERRRPTFRYRSDRKLAGSLCGLLERRPLSVDEQRQARTGGFAGEHSPFSSSRSGTVPAHDLMASQRIRKNGATFPGWTHRCRSMNRRTGRCQFREIYWAEKPSDLRYTAFDRAGNRFVLDDLRLALDR
jgi:hypothetical protein